MARTQLTAALLQKFEQDLREQAATFDGIKKNMDNALTSFLWDDPVAHKFKADYEEKLKPLQTKLLPAMEKYQNFLNVSAQKAEGYTEQSSGNSVGTFAVAGAGAVLGGATAAKFASTKAVPISNGCGSEEKSVKGWASRVGANYGGKQIDAVKMGTSIEEQNQSCDKHDEDYYHGIDRETADREFKERSPLMGSFVEGNSESSWNAAQVDKPQSENLRPTWEEENQQCLNTEHYKVEPKTVEDYKKDSEKIKANEFIKNLI
jgi:hypothetical protein